jgi:LmbE family N-acetylglucosaminyl deacetylase
MKLVELAGSGERLSILCIGAHSDDIEIRPAQTPGLDRARRALDVH